MNEGRERRYQWLLRLARGALLWERLWPRAWPLAGVIGLFVALALLDLSPAVPAWLHLVALIVFGLAMAVALRHAVAGFGLVGSAAARRRLECDSGLSHRPLAALEDRLASGSADTSVTAVWQRHRQRMALAADRLRVRWPRPDIASADPLALRAVVMLLLIISVVAAGPEAGARMARALAPDLGSSGLGGGTVDVWITPPAYTGRAPLLLRSTAEAGTVPTPDVLTLPAGSTVLAQASGVSRPPELAVNGQRVAFQPIAGSTGVATDYRAEAAVVEGNALAIVAGRRTLAEWPIRVVADAAPEISFAAPVDATAEGLLVLSYQASDDYGVETVSAVVRRDGTDAPIRLDLPVSEPGAPTASNRSRHDLTAHPWAGRAVSIHLEASDAAGQTGLSEAKTVRLPERRFSHPVARAVIAQRRQLADDDVDAAARQQVAAALEHIAAAPAAFANDIVVSLALAVARSRLLVSHAPTAVATVRQMLWETAMRIEHGTVPMAERSLRDARDALAEALRRDAAASELNSLIDAVEQALEAYLAAVVDALMRQGLTAEGETVVPTAPLAAQDMRDLLDMVRQLAEAGARDGAHAALAQLERMLEGLRAGLMGGVQPASDMAEAGRLMRALADLTQRQQALLDETFASLQSLGDRLEGESLGLMPQEPAAETGPQENLRRALGDLMLGTHEFLGSIPEPLGLAERAMRDAGDHLRRNRLGLAAESQGQALAQLEAAAAEAAAAMAERFGSGGGLLLGSPGMGYAEPGSDPFGRFGGGAHGFGIGEVAVPDGAEIRRAQEVLQELRRRAGESHRRPEELDYIERLLRRF